MVTTNYKLCKWKKKVLKNSLIRPGQATGNPIKKSFKDLIMNVQ